MVIYYIGFIGCLAIYRINKRHLPVSAITTISLLNYNLTFEQVLIVSRNKSGYQCKASDSTLGLIQNEYNIMSSVLDMLN